MGKQILFYMVHKDEEMFLNFVRSTGDVVITPLATDKRSGEYFSSFATLVDRRLGEGCCLWNRSFSPTPILHYYDVHGGCYCVDTMESEVIDVIRSIALNDQLSMGRLHIEDRYQHVDGSLRTKSDKFIYWFDQLRSWVTRHCPAKYQGAYMSEGAQKLAAQGVMLTGHRI